MRDLIYNIQELALPAEPLKLLDEQGKSLENEGKEIIDALKEVLEANPDMIAVNAAQLGFNKRIFCIRFNDMIKCFINPIITKKSKMSIVSESCTLYPGKEFIISRPTQITAVYYTQEFKYEQNKLLGAAAAIFDQQHQILEGVFPEELGLMSDIETDGKVADLTDEEFEQVKDIYKQYIEAKTKSMTEAVTSNSELAKSYRQLKFTEDVINGRTQVIVNEPKLKQSTLQKTKTDKAERASKLRHFVSNKKPGKKK